MSVTFTTYSFVRNHGKRPYGYGTWFFKIGSATYQTVGMYGECKKEATAKAKELGVHIVKVLS